MGWCYIKQVIKIFLGICLLLLGTGVLLFNLFLASDGFDTALLLLNVLILLAGLLLTVFGITALPKEEDTYIED